MGFRIPSHLDTGLDEDHSEYGVAVEASLDHQLVTLFENVQGKEAAGEQHHVEREQGNRPLSIGHGSTVHAWIGGSTWKARPGSACHFSRLDVRIRLLWGFV